MEVGGSHPMGPADALHAGRRSRARSPRARSPPARQIGKDNGAMDFIANATGAIYAKSWTPQLQKLVAGQQTPGGAAEVGAERLREPGRGLTPMARSMLDRSAERPRPRPGGRVDDAEPARPAGLRTAAGSAGCSSPRRSSFYAVFVLRPLVLTVPVLAVRLGRHRRRPPGSGWTTTSRSSPIPTCSPRSLQRLQADRRSSARSRSCWAWRSPSTIRRIAASRLALVARTVLFLPQVIPLVAAGIAWSWLLSSTGAGQPAARRASASAA